MSFVCVAAKMCILCYASCSHSVTSLITFFAEGPRKSRRATVTGEAVGSLHAATPVLAEGAVAAAVTRTSGPNARSYLCPLLQVQRGAIQLQRADAAAEAPLPGRCAA